MSDTVARVALALAALLFLPAIVAGGGFIIAVILAVAVLGTILGGRWGVRLGTDIWKNREFGAKAGQQGADVREMVGRGPDEDDWGRK